MFDCSQIPDAKNAALRILEAIEKQERIGIFGDYDCDGVTSTAQLVRFFARRNIRPTIRLPHRIDDGYGLNMQIVEEWKEQQIDLLITVDTGISALHEVAALRSAGIDVVIIDHHSIPDQKPDALIVHPALSHEEIAFPPAAAGMVWSFLHLLEDASWSERHIDCILAGIGTIADLVPLQKQNRTLVSQAVELLRKQVEGPLGEFAHLAGGTTLSATDIAFRIAPRINAAGRLSHPEIALNALLHGGTFLTELEELNAMRQDTTALQFDQADALLDLESNNDALLFLANSEYHPGIIGLLAGRLTEKSGKPSCIANIRSGMCTASLRSIPEYDIAAALRRHAHLFTTFGGHAQAAGCTFPEEQMHAVRSALLADARSILDPSTLVPMLTIDAALEMQSIGTALCTALQTFGPFGQGNPEPRFLLRNVLLQKVRTVGAEGIHLQASLEHIKLIGFRLGHLLPYAHEPIDIVCRLGVHIWNEKTSPQLFIEDLACSSSIPTPTPELASLPC